MNEYSPQVRNPKTVPITALFVVVVIAGLAAYWMMSYFRVTWDPVKYVPQDCVAAVIVDVTGSGEKRAALSSIEKALREAGIDDPGQAFVERFEQSLGVKLNRDIIQHLNGRGAVVLIPEMSGVTPGAAVVIGARRDRDAAAVKEIIVSGIADDQQTPSELSYKGFDYVVLQNSRFKSYIGIVDGGVVCATTGFAFKKIVDTVKGGKCLRDNAEFARLNNTDESTVATLFFSGTQCEKMVGPMMMLGSGSLPVPGLKGLPEAMENNLATAGTLNAHSDSINLHIKGITRKPLLNQNEVSLNKLLAHTPADAAIAFIVNDWDKTWAAIKKQLMSDAAVKQQIEQAAAQARTFLFMDPFSDGLDRITALGGYYVPDQSLNNDFPGYFTLTARVDKPEVVQTTMGKVHFAMAMMGGTALTEVSVEGKKAYMGPDNGPVRYSDAMIDDKFLLIISGKKPGAAVSRSVVTAIGHNQNLAASEQFKTMKKHLPDKACALLYCNLGIVARSFDGFTGNKAPKQDKAMIEKFGKFTISASAEGTEYEVRGVMPLQQ